MGQFAKRGFNASDGDKQAWKGRADQIGIDDGGTIGAFTCNATWCIGVIVAFLAEGCVVAEHGIQGACADAAEEPWTAKPCDVFRGIPAWLGDNADFVTVVFEPSCQQGDAKTGMVDIGISCDEKDIKLLPAASIHIIACDGKPGGWS